jgi:hypothetical protein
MPRILWPLPTPKIRKGSCRDSALVTWVVLVLILLSLAVLPAGRPVGSGLPPVLQIRGAPVVEDPGTPATPFERIDAGSSWSLAQPSPLPDPAYWSNITALGAGAPGATYGGAMAFDPATNTTVFLGGDSPSSLDESWTYNHYNWSEPFLGVPDTFAALGYDASDSELIAFGGGAPLDHEVGTTIPTNATYGFSGGVWTNLSAGLSTSPPPTPLPLMASDPATGSALLLDPGASVNDSQTWSFANGSWTNLTASAGLPPPGPSGSDSVMTYDPTLGGVVFFGGSVPGPGFSNATNETWEFLSGRWTDLNLSGPDFATGAVQTMAFDGAANTLVDLVAPAYLYAENGSPAYEDWEFVGGGWTNETAHLPATPPIGYDPLSEWDPADGYLFYLAGGYDAQSWALGSTPLAARLTVAPAPVDVGNSTTFTVTVTGGAPPLRYAFSGLPPGCANVSEERLACRPTQPGNFTVGVTVTDSTNTSVTAYVALEVGSRFSASGPLVPYPFAYNGSSVPFSVSVTGGVPPYQYQWAVSAASCALPDAATFQCTVDRLGGGQVSVLVTDATPQGGATASENLTVVTPPAIASFAVSARELEVGQAFFANTTVVGGAPPLTFNYTGLPPGCHGASLPSIPCTPTGSGSFNLTVNVTDGLGTVVRATTPVTIVPPVAIRTEEVDPNPAVVGSVVTFNYTVSGGVAPFRAQWVDLPPGCRSSSFAFACSMNSTGSFDVELTVRDLLGGVARSNVTLQVSPGGNASPAPNGLSAVPSWTWGALAVGGMAVVILAWWDRRRRRATPDSDGPPGEDAPGVDGASEAMDSSPR